MAKKNGTPTKTKNGTKKPRKELQDAFDKAEKEADNIIKMSEALPAPLSKIEKIAMDNLIDWKIGEDQKVQVLQQQINRTYQQKVTEFVNVITEERGIAADDHRFTFALPDGVWGLQSDLPKAGETVPVEGDKGGES